MQPILNDEDAMVFPPGSSQEKKFLEVTNGTIEGIKMAKRLGVKTAFGTDLIFDPVAAKNRATANMQNE
jgi:imidazolonepropionase-like amidohydrolase